MKLVKVVGNIHPNQPSNMAIWALLKIHLKWPVDESWQMQKSPGQCQFRDICIWMKEMCCCCYVMIVFWLMTYALSAHTFYNAKFATKQLNTANDVLTQILPTNTFYVPFHRHKNNQDTHKDIQTDTRGHIHKQAHTQTVTDTQRQKHKHRQEERYTHRQTHTYTQTQRHRQTERQKDRERHHPRHIHISKTSVSTVP